MEETRSLLTKVGRNIRTAELVYLSDTGQKSEMKLYPKHTYADICPSYFLKTQNLSSLMDCVRKGRGERSYSLNLQGENSSKSYSMKNVFFRMLIDASTPCCPGLHKVQTWGFPMSPTTILFFFPLIFYYSCLSQRLSLFYWRSIWFVGKRAPGKWQELLMMQVFKN